MARSSLGAEVVRDLLATMRADKVILKAAQVDIDRLEPAVAMADLRSRCMRGSGPIWRRAAISCDESDSGVRMIQGVEHIESELQSNRFSNARVLRDSEVEIVQSRPRFGIARHISIRRAEQSGRAWPVEDHIHIVFSYRHGVSAAVEFREVIEPARVNDRYSEQQRCIDLIDAVRFVFGAFGISIDRTD
ncbi:MAG: hypothetical protein HC871_11925, partial [Rhizobiales bacterium]|nr:hypothetical protein [Hyphomicrobiales bacterium]